MAKQGWSAKGLLRPLWKQYPGGRDALAKAAHTNGADLSARNTGRVNLGHDLAGRLVQELSRELGREVSLLELGAPEVEADEVGQTLVHRLESLAGDLAVAVEKQVAMAREMRRLRERVRHLEARPWPNEASSTDQAR